ncbi:Carboxylesterase type B [Penicillium vulpinum]|uniref:Carboxylesterase type B n=1 Tax=Penicillium vulpinum TaxID=29845 RepID=UPI002548E60E|nr:Carboxylesterase type B [Penicillium vulpinum]KAJ5971387.1 Carboxylesterase type B [Penicillium vulpinum]
MRHIIAYRGSELQSPTYVPCRSAGNHENTFKDFLDWANVTSLTKLYTSAIYGLTLDGSLVKADPKKMIGRGEHDQSAKMRSQNSEGLVSVLTVHTNEDLGNIIRLSSTFVHVSGPTIHRSHIGSRRHSIRPYLIDEIH